jgi:hypothetical protein
VPTNNAALGQSAKATEPRIEQCFLSASSNPVTTSPDPDAQVDHPFSLSPLSLNAFCPCMHACMPVFESLQNGVITVGVVGLGNLWV